MKMSGAKSSRRSLPLLHSNCNGGTAAAAAAAASAASASDMGCNLAHHDLDLYYIRQIASHMKVHQKCTMCNREKKAELN